MKFNIFFYFGSDVVMLRFFQSIQCSGRFATRMHLVTWAVMISAMTAPGYWPMPPEVKNFTPRFRQE